VINKTILGCKERGTKVFLGSHTVHLITNSVRVCVTMGVPCSLNSLQVMDKIIAGCTERGIKVILD